MSTSTEKGKEAVLPADPSRPLRLLSIDGGGIRGLSALYILEGLMTRIGAKEKSDSPLLPCNYFDLIGGTSTGGLIAVMLGPLRMDIKTCIAKYLELAPKIFPLEGYVSGSKIVKGYKAVRGKHRFDPKPMEFEVKKMVTEYLGERATEGDNTPLLFEASSNLDKPHCKIFVCTNSETPRTSVLARSYNSYWSTNLDCAIWEACRATSAAPTFFPPVLIGNPQMGYVDGGLGYNNPIRKVIEEAGELWKGRAIGCAVSIGMGVPSLKNVGQNLTDMAQTLLDIATETQQTADEVKNEMHSKFGVQQQVYHRLNVQQGLSEIGLEEWKRFGEVKTVTGNYLNNHRPEMEICATQLLEPQRT